MKADVHPTYGPSTVTCTCGNTFVTGSTQPEMNLEICAQCHPFYTGKQKVLDTAGKVSKFEARMAKKTDERVSKKEKNAQRRANKQVKIEG